MDFKINNKKHSECGSADLATLDFNNWFADTSNDMFYLHVLGPEETWHRVFCKYADTPRIAMKKGVLYWIAED